MVRVKFCYKNNHLVGFKNLEYHSIQQPVSAKEFMIFRQCLQTNVYDIMYFSVNIFNYLCRYRKQTDIYYSTWSFENEAKICQFQFLEPPHTLTIFGGLKKVFRRPTHQLIFHGIWHFQFLDPPPTHTLTIFGGIKTFLYPQKLWNLALSVFRPPTHKLTVFGA